MTIIELLTTKPTAPWLPWAVQYFFFIGIAASAAILFAFSYNPQSRWRPWHQRLGFIVSLSAITGLVALLADLHQPARFHHFYTQLTPSSWMWIGSLILPVFAVLSLIVGFSLFKEQLEFKQPLLRAWLNAKIWPNTQWQARLATIAAVAALGVFLFTGMEVMVVKARSLWHTPWLPINLLSTAFLGLLGLLLLLELLFPRSDKLSQASLRTLRRAFLYCLAAISAGAILWAISGELLQSVSWLEAKRLYQHFNFWHDLILLSAVGGLLMWALAIKQRHAKLGWLDYATAPLALLCAWGFRWVVLMNVQTVPKYGAGLYHLDAALLSSANYIVLGTLGLWLALAGVVWFLLDNAGVRHG